MAPVGGVDKGFLLVSKIIIKDDFIWRYISRQVENIVPDGYCLDAALIKCVPIALDDFRRRLCLAREPAGNDFNYLISWHHALFVYLLSKVVWKEAGDCDAATRLFLLNKAVNGIDLFYEVEMGRNFLIGHTVGAVFAKAIYGDYCVFHQGCTVGRQKDKRPILGDGTVMFPGSRIIGDCLIRENTVISAGVTLINTSTPGNCIVFEGKGNYPVFKEIGSFYADKYFFRNSETR